MIFETFETKDDHGNVTDKIGMRFGFKGKDGKGVQLNQYKALIPIMDKLGISQDTVIQNAKQMGKVFQANAAKEVLDTDYDAMKRYAAITGKTERDIAARSEQLSRMSEETRNKVQSANFNPADMDAWYSAQSDAIKYSAMSTKEFTEDLTRRKAKLQAFVDECRRIGIEDRKNKRYGIPLKSDTDIRAEAMANLGDFDDDLKGYAKSMDLNGDTVENWSKKQTAAFDNAAKSAKKFSAAAKATLANVGLEMGIALAIMAIGKAWQWANDKFKITPAKKIEAMENAVNNYNEALSNSTENIETIKSLESEFNRLAQGVNGAGENIGLSVDEYARYNEIVSELVKINPELVQGYTDEGNAIVNRNTAIQEGIKLQEEYANKATRDYVDNGSDILKGARTNANKSLKDAQKAAKELGSMSMQLGSESGMSFGKAFSKSLQGEAALGDALENKIGNTLNNAFVEGGTVFGYNQQFQAVISDYLGYEVDLASASIATLRKVDNEFEGIIAHAEKMGYSNSSIKDFEYQYQNFHDAFAEIDADYQPIIDWLNGVANVVNSEGESTMSSIPESMQAAFQAGIEEIAYAGGSEEFMKKATKDFASVLSEVGETDEYVDALEKAEEAQEDFMDSSRSADDAIEYKETVKEQSDAVKDLADQYRAAGDAVTAAALDFKATEILNFATENVMTLTEALNPLIDKFEEARGAKEEWDAAMEASGDYDTAIDSFKEVYDEIIDGEDNKGNGSRGFWTGAEQMLGTTNMIELGSFSKVNSEIKELKTILSGGESGARAFFKRLYDCRDALNEVTDGAVKFDAATGEVSFDFDEDKWAEYADALGVSEEMLSAMVDMSRQWTDIDLGNIDTIKTAIKDMDSTEISDGGEYYQLFSTVWECAAAAGYSLEEFNNRVDDMEKAGIHLIKVDDFFKEDTIDEATNKLIEMNDALGSKNGEKYTVNADAIIAQLFKMGVTAEDTTRILEEMQEAGYSFNPKNFKKGADEDMDDYVDDLYSDMSEGSEDFTERITSGIDNITNSIDQLCIALGSLPANWADKVTSGIDDVESRLNKAAESKDITKTSGKTDKKSVNSRKTSLKGIYDKIDAQEEYINQLESTGKADAKTVQAARERLADLKDYADDLLDDGLLNGSINIDTSALESNRLKELLGGEDSKEYKLIFKAATSGTTEELLETVGNLDEDIQADVVVELVKSGAFDNFLGDLGDDEKNIVINAIVNGSGDVDELVGILKTVEDEEVRTQIIVDLVQAGSFDSLLGGLNNNQKNVVISAIVEGEGNAEQLNKIISKLPEDKQMEVRAKIDEAVDGIEIVKGKLAEVKDEKLISFTGNTDDINAASKRVQGMINGVPGEKIIKFSGYLTKSFKNAWASFKNAMKEGAKSMGFNVETDDGEGSGYLGTPQSPNYRSHSSFPSMAKGGRLGPRGNGGLTLTGELGTELVWIPSESRSFLVGQYGPEMVNLPGDAVVYPAEETRKIIGDAIHPSRLRFGTGSMAKGSMQFGSMGDANGSMSIYGTGGITNKNKNNRKKITKSNYDKELAKLDHQLEMGYITEVKYYNKLVNLYNKYKTVLKKNVEDNREALEKKHDARIDAYEHEKAELDHQLEMGWITEKQYYNRLDKLGDKYYKGQKGYSDEWKQHQKDERDAKKEYLDKESEDLKDKLDKDIINIRKFVKENAKLRKQMTKEDQAENKENTIEAAGDEMSKEIDKIMQAYEDFELGLDGGKDADATLDALNNYLIIINNLAKDYPELADVVKEATRDIAQYQQDLLDDTKDKVEDIWDLVESTIRQEAEDRIDAIETSVDKYNELIDAKKEALQITEQELDYQDKLNDSSDEISKLQAEIAVLSRDDSRAGQAKLAEKQAELAEALKERDRTVRDETISRSEDALDAQAELFEELSGLEVDKINKFLDDQSAVNKAVIEHLKNMDSNDLIDRTYEYNRVHGDGWDETAEIFWKTFAGLVGDGYTLEDIVKMMSDPDYKGEQTGTTATSQAAEDWVLDQIGLGNNSTIDSSNNNEGLPVKIIDVGEAAKTAWIGDLGDAKRVAASDTASEVTPDGYVKLTMADISPLSSDIETIDIFKKNYDTIFEHIKDEYVGLSSAIANSAITNFGNATIEISVNTPITIQGSVDDKIMEQLESYGSHIANTTLDKLQSALTRRGINNAAIKNVRKN